MNKLTIQEVHTYMHLADQGKVPHIPCPVNKDHVNLIPDLDKEGNVYFYCLACNVRLRPGERFTNLIHKYLQRPQS